MMTSRIGLFAVQAREDRRSKLGDPLVGLDKHLDVEALASCVDTAAPRPSPAKGGHPSCPMVLMIEILVLHLLHKLADAALAFQLLDRRSVLGSLDQTASSNIPDAKTIGLFRDRLAQAGVSNQVFEQVHQQLLSQAYLARYGPIVHASFGAGTIQRNKREEAETVKDGRMPLEWKMRKPAQEDGHAKWKKKQGKNQSALRRCGLVGLILDETF